MTKFSIRSIPPQEEEAYTHCGTPPAIFSPFGEELLRIIEEED